MLTVRFTVLPVLHILQMPNVEEVPAPGNEATAGQSSHTGLPER